MYSIPKRTLSTAHTLVIYKWNLESQHNHFEKQELPKKESVVDEMKQNRTEEWIRCYA